MASNYSLLRIAVDAHRVSHELQTSGHQYLALMLPYWSNDVRVEVIDLLIPRTRSTHHISDHILKLPKIRVIQDDVLTNPLGKWERQFYYQQVTIPKLLKRTDANIYFSPFHLPPLRTGNVPVVTAIHDLCIISQPVTSLGSLKHREIHRLQIQLASRKSRHLIAVSEFTADALRAYLPIKATAVSVVPNGIAFTSDAWAEANPSEAPSGSYAIWVGYPGYRKNPELTFDTFSAIRKNWTNLKLYCVCPYPYQKELRSMAASHGIADSTLFLSDVPNAMLASMYQHAEFCVISSRCEGFGYPILEAISRGCPVVAWKNSPAAEILGPEFALPETLTTAAFSSAAMTIPRKGDEKRKSLEEMLITRSRIFGVSQGAYKIIDIFHDCLNGFVENSPCSNQQSDAHSQKSSGIGF